MSKGISLDPVNWSSMSVDFHTGSGVKISLSTGITHESPRATVRLEPDVGRCKSEELTETIS